MPLIIALVLCSLIAADVVAAPSRAFLRLDKNNDGQLSAAELSNAPAGLIKAIDGNGDGVITAREDERYFSSRNRPPQIDRIAAKKSTHPYANNDNPRQTVDVYQPLSRKSTKLPLLIFIHGGGWRSGSKDSGVRQLSDYVRSGNYVGASIGYRLSGEAQWPAQIHDCKAAIRYLELMLKKLLSLALQPVVTLAVWLLFPAILPNLKAKSGGI